ncbi:MAG TPA: rod shape-determining protein MreC [Coxiellaceae bacterium]|nr:MAG: rod shape-determining protein MreC [Gammaproteobacteria bacterium RBG_16_37_9]HBC72085.1 rod shape-determining protein MreC [Coxiellaceae bacterium]
MRSFILVVVSLILFFFDHKSHYFDALRSQVSFIVIPIQYAVNWPVELAHILKDNFVSKQIIFEENNQLRTELLQINAKLQRLDFLEHENSQLRVLLNSSKPGKSKIVAAQLLNSVVDNFGQQITIDKGKQHGVYVGQPVLDAYGLLGQVILVEDLVSKVLLITNGKSAIPVMINRNGFRTIALGVGSSDYLELVNIPETADIKEGDSLVTSGLGQRFPAGHLIGVVSEVKRVVGERFLKVVVVPAAHINRDLHVLLVWPAEVERVKRVKK